MAYLITGCNSGLGLQLARRALALGKNVAATARDVRRLGSMVEEHGGERLLVLPADVTNANSIAAAVVETLEHFGRIDVAINNAGYCYLAAIEEGESDEIARILDTNLMGSIRLIQKILPIMRQQGSGTIVNVSSLAGVKGFSGMGYYCASKFALEGISQSLREEVASLGIRVLTVNAGGMATNFCGSSLSHASENIADYAESAGISKRLIAQADQAMLGSPALAAEAILAEIEGATGQDRLVLGDDARHFIALAANSLLREAEKAVPIGAEG